MDSDYRDLYDDTAAAGGKKSSKKNKKKKRKKPIRLPGIVITITLLLLSIEFVGMLWMTQLIPDYFLIAGGLALLTMVLIIYLFVRNMRKKAPFVIGVLLAILMGALMVVGNFYILSTVNVLSQISGVNTRTSEMGVYVRTDDPAESLEDASGYTFAVMTDLDAENSQAALTQLYSQLGDVDVVEVGGVMEIAQGLLEGEYDAMILNSAYIDVLADIEDYADIEDRVRELDKISVVIEESEEIVSEDADLPEILQIYISGVDTRESSITNSRSDVNIVATINTKTKQVVLISTPRDYYVPLSISNGECDKLTHAGIYGIDCSMDTLSMLYDADIKYYFRVNFTGFVDIIDALGGIDVYSETDFTSELAEGTFSYTEGMNHLSGEEALSFARERHAFASGDRARGTHQMEVIRAVLEKAMTPEILKKYSSIMTAVSGSFETNISYSMIADIVKMQLSDGAEWNIVSYSVDGTGDTRKPYSLSTAAYVMVPDETTVEHAMDLMQQVIDGEIVVDETEAAEEAEDAAEAE